MGYGKLYYIFVIIVFCTSFRMISLPVLTLPFSKPTWRFKFLSLTYGVYHRNSISWRCIDATHLLICGLGFSQLKDSFALWLLCCRENGGVPLFGDSVVWRILLEQGISAHKQMNEEEMGKAARRSTV